MFLQKYDLKFDLFSTQILKLDKEKIKQKSQNTILDPKLVSVGKVCESLGFLVHLKGKLE